MNRFSESRPESHEGQVPGSDLFLRLEGLVRGRHGLGIGRFEIQQSRIQPPIDLYQTEL